MNIQKDLIAVNQFSRPGRKLPEVKALVVHWVANPGSTAKQNRNYFDSLKGQRADDPSARYASAHFVVGIEGETVQCLPSGEMAYHAGAKTYTPQAKEAFGVFPNNCTVGIEMCHPKADGKFTGQTLAAAAELCALLCIQHGLDPMRDIWTHHGITGKDCPKWFVDHPDDFAQFKQAVAEEAKRLGAKP